MSSAGQTLDMRVRSCRISAATKSVRSGKMRSKCEVVTCIVDPWHDDSCKLGNQIDYQGREIFVITSNYVFTPSPLHVSITSSNKPIHFIQIVPSNPPPHNLSLNLINKLCPLANTAPFPYSNTPWLHTFLPSVLSTQLKRLGRQGRGIRIHCCRCNRPEKRRRLVGVAGASLDVGSDEFVRC